MTSLDPIVHSFSSLAVLAGSCPTAFCSNANCARYAARRCSDCNQEFCSSCDTISSVHKCSSDVPRSLLPPIADQRSHLVTFGEVEGENRGNSSLFQQPRIKNDPWFWLRDDDRKNSEVLDHLKAENAYTAQQTAHLDEFRQKLYQEHISHLKETDDDPAFSDGPFFYYTKTIKGLSYKIHCRKQKKDSKMRLPEDELSEIVVLDENAIAEGHPQCSICGVRPSPDHALLTYAVDFNGSEDFEVRFKKLDNSGELTDRLEKVEGGSAIFGSHAQSVFYVTRDETKRPYKLWHHTLGTAQAEDTCLFTEDDEMFNLDCYKSASGQFLFAETSSKETSEVWYLDLSSFSPSSTLSVIQPRTFGLRYEAEHLADDFLLITTNKDDKPNNRLMTAKFGTCAQEHWVDLIPYDETRWIEDFRVFARHVVLAGRQGGISRLWLLDINTEKDVEVRDLRRLEFPEELYEVSISVNREYDSPYLRLTYSSLITPPTWFDYVMDKNETNPLLLVKQVEILEYDNTRYECFQLHAKSFDGTFVPMSVVRLKSETKEDKKEPGPLLLYGYGSYGLCIDPGFDRSLLPYLDRGVTYVIAHIRGGGEMGRAWYEQQGKYLTKRNTFLDFISCAEHLIQTGLTSPELLAIEGRSAGGLLMGAVVNMRPDLFRIALAGVPFVDVMTTMCDASIPLTTSEWEEWGNPNDPKYFDYMLSYSPIDQVRAQPYPTILITTGLHDPRVAYWEPAKWASKLRAVKAAQTVPAKAGKVALGEVLMKTDLETGHFSASDRYRKIRELSFEMSVVLDCLGLVK